jgi:hypothetical protein
MRKLKEMKKEDIELVIKVSYLLGELNKKYKYPHGKNPMGIVIYALEEIEKRKKEAVKK